MNTMAIGRGWTVITADGKRVGDVTEVHPHYLLVSQGILFVRDRYLPLGTVERVEEKRVILGLTAATLRGMNLANVPPPPVIEPSTAAMADPMPVSSIDSIYTPEPYTADAGNYTSGGWQSDSVADYMETPSYTRPQPNGLVEIEHGLNLAFADHGYGQAIILVPGWPFDSAVWEPLPTMLAQDFRVITYDHRGTGKSDAPWDYYSVDAMAGDLHRLLVEQALYDVTLVAWSTGATVALSYAHSYPKRITRVVLLAPLIPQWLGTPAADEAQGDRSVLDTALQETWAAELLADRAAFFPPLIERMGGAGWSEPRRQWLWQRLLLGGHHAQVKTWEAMRDYDPTDFLAEIQIPFTILSNAGDQLSPPALGAKLADLLPKASHGILDGQDHALFVDQRDTVIALLRDLLNPPEEPVEAMNEDAHEEPASEEAAEPEGEGDEEPSQDLERVEQS